MLLSAPILGLKRDGALDDQPPDGTDLVIGNFPAADKPKKQPTPKRPPLSSDEDDEDWAENDANKRPTKARAKRQISAAKPIASETPGSGYMQIAGGVGQAGKAGRKMPPYGPLGTVKPPDTQAALEKWKRDLARFMAGTRQRKGPAAHSPFAPAAAAPQSEKAEFITGPAVPDSVGFARPPDVAPPPGGDSVAQNKNGGGGTDSSSQASADSSGVCPSESQPLSAPTRENTNRTICVGRPPKGGAPTADALSAALDRLKPIFAKLLSLAQEEARGALQETAKNAGTDVRSASDAVGRIESALETARGALTGKDRQTKGALAVLDRLDAYLTTGDGPIPGLASALTDISSAKACLDGNSPDQMSACMKSAVMPGLGRKLHNEADQEQFLSTNILLRDPEVIDPSIASVGPYQSFLAAAREAARTAAAKLQDAEAEWDKVRDDRDHQPGAGFATTASKLQGDFEEAVSAMTKAGAFDSSVDDKQALWTQVAVARVALGDAVSGWKQSADASPKPVARLEGAVDGEKGTLDGVLAGARIVSLVKKEIQRLKEEPAQ